MRSISQIQWSFAMPFFSPGSISCSKNHTLRSFACFPLMSPGHSELVSQKTYDARPLLFNDKMSLHSYQFCFTNKYKERKPHTNLGKQYSLSHFAVLSVKVISLVLKMPLLRHTVCVSCCIFVIYLPNGSTSEEITRSKST